MQDRMDSMQRDQQEMALRLKSLSFNYQRSTDKIESLEKTLAKQDELIRTLVDVVARGDPNTGSAIFSAASASGLGTGSSQGPQPAFQTLGRVAAVIPTQIQFNPGSNPQQTKEQLEAALARYASLGFFDTATAQMMGQQQTHHIQLQSQQSQLLQQQQQLQALQHQQQQLQSQLPGGMPNLASVMTPSPQQEQSTPQQTQQQQQVILDTVFAGIPFAQQQQQLQLQVQQAQQAQQQQQANQQPLQFFNGLTATQQQQLALQQLQQQQAAQQTHLQVFQQQQQQSQYAAQPKKPLSQMAPHWTAPPKVLLVEDDDTCRRLSSKLLQIFGCNFDIAVDGLDAVNRMGVGYKYDIVLMDIMMPNLDGVSATTRIRQFDKSTPIISMTSNITDADCMTYLANGMNDVLPKPFNKKTLLGMILRYCAHRSQDGDDVFGLPKGLLPQEGTGSSSSSSGVNDAGEKITEVEEEDEDIVPVSTNGGVRPPSLLPQNNDDPISGLPALSTHSGANAGSFDDQFMDLLRMTEGPSDNERRRDSIFKDSISKKRVRRDSD
jgi:CheY-like chemotaxis protein